jgi:hypothetical protein
MSLIPPGCSDGAKSNPDLGAGPRGGLHSLDCSSEMAILDHSLRYNTRKSLGRISEEDDAVLLCTIGDG